MSIFENNTIIIKSYDCMWLKPLRQLKTEEVCAHCNMVKRAENIE